MFRGHSYRSLDPKGRLMLPPEYREVIAAGAIGGEGGQATGALILTKFFDECVAGYPLREWEPIELKLRALSDLDEASRAVKRFLMGNATLAELDRQGRVLVPPYLREWAGLGKDVVLAGVGPKFEIWDQAAFDRRRRAMDESLADKMAALAAKGVSLPL